MDKEGGVKGEGGGTERKRPTSWLGTAERAQGREGEPIAVTLGKVKQPDLVRAGGTDSG